MAVSKLSIYNDACILLGQRILSSDSEARPIRFKLDALYDNEAVDYCLEIVKPRFAVTLVALAGGSVTLESSYTFEATLPSTFQSLVGVFADSELDQEITRFTHESNKILSDFSTIYVRHVQDFATVGLTNMSAAFSRVVGAFLARELSISFDPDETERLDAELTARIEISVANDTDTEPENKGLAAAELTTEWRQVYNDALMLLALPRLASNTDDSLRKNQLDIARTSELVEAAFEDIGWQFGLESQKLTFNSAIEWTFGPRYPFDKPADMHRLDSIAADEYYTSPIRDYVDEGDFLWCDYQIIYLTFVSNDTMTTPATWPSYFKRMVAANLAVDAGPSIPGANIANAVDRRRERVAEAKSTDAMRSPPKRLTEGLWAASRAYGGRTVNRNRP
jgi:flagellar biosynthesis regulator FlbT